MGQLLTGKAAVITGIGPGIGRATALAFAREGADLAIGARTEATLKELAGEIEDLGRRCVYHPTNIADADDCAALAQTALEGLGKIDVLVQNAFMSPAFSSAVDSDPEEWRRSYKVNVIGTLQMVQACLPHMGEGASIVITNSMASRNVPPHPGAGPLSSGTAAYAGAKAALLSMVRSLTRDIGPRGIRINSVVPGWVHGPSLDVYFEWIASEQGITTEQALANIAEQTALKRIVSPEDVAGAILFLASDLAHGITGQAIDVNAGHWIP